MSKRGETETQQVLAAKNEVKALLRSLKTAFIDANLKINDSRTQKYLDRLQKLIGKYTDKNALKEIENDNSELLRKFTGMKEKALKIKAKLIKKTGAKLEEPVQPTKKPASPEISEKKKKRETKAAQKTAAKKSVMFKEEDNEVVREISGVERKWNDFKAIKSQLVQGKF